MDFKGNQIRNLDSIFLGNSPEFHPKKFLRISPGYFSGHS